MSHKLLNTELLKYYRLCLLHGFITIFVEFGHVFQYFHWFGKKNTL